MNWTHRFRRGDNKQISWSRIKASVSTFGTDFGPVHGKFRFFCSFHGKRRFCDSVGVGPGERKSAKRDPGRKKAGSAPSRYVKRWRNADYFYLLGFYHERERIPPAGWMGVELFLSYCDFLFLYLFTFLGVWNKQNDQIQIQDFRVQKHYSKLCPLVQL